jgi:hypothetical protein
MPTDQENIARYDAALHAIQNGAKLQLEIDPTPGTPKHLRVGIDSAMCEHSALALLLEKKGVFTRNEYFEAIAVAMETEKERYEKALSQHFGYKIILH